MDDMDKDTQSQAPAQQEGANNDLGINLPISPRPWSVEVMGHTIRLVNNKAKDEPHGDDVMHFQGMCDPQVYVDAHHAAMCVNAHEALLKALREVEEWCNRDDGHGEGCAMDDYGAEIARKALDLVASEGRS